jgi:tRNA modification GTPase
MTVDRLAAASDTICALATSALSGGVGIVRLSGPNALPIALRLTHRRTAPEPRRLVYTRFFDGDRALDDGLFVSMPAPRSYTGDDTVELHAHGGTANLSRLLRVLVSAGARPAEPGEFTLRAFLNGRIDLAQAEAVIDVVEAPTETALDVAQNQLRGGLSSVVRAHRDALLDVHAALEVQIDFSDDDLGEALDARHTQALDEAVIALDALASSWARGRVLRSGARVLLAGAPNAGKSSLFNALLRQHRAIVTPVPGTTRDFLEERVDLGGVPIVLIDSAGLRDGAADAVEAEGMARTRTLAQQADLVLWLDDPTTPEASGPESLGLTGKGVLRLRTKADLADGDVSAVTGAGLAALEDQLRARLLGAAPEHSTGVVVTNARHHSALSAAGSAARQAAEASRRGLPPELVVIDVAEAVYQLGLVVGASTTEDMLDRIFSRFCIGK